MKCSFVPQEEELPLLHLVPLVNFPIFMQLQLEEALLRTDERNWCILNVEAPPAIVMGISGKAELLIDQERMQRAPVPLIRRFSGGGTVFIDEDTYFITLICNSEKVQVPCCPDKILRWTEKLYRPAFGGIGFCLKENDYAIGEKKFGGNAQYMRKNRWLHHTSLLWDFSQARMEYLLLPAKTPHYRQKRLHEEFLCTLRPHFATKALLQKKLIASLHTHFKVKEVGVETLQEILQLPHRKATTYAAMPTKQ